MRLDQRADIIGPEQETVKPKDEKVKATIALVFFFLILPLNCLALDAPPPQIDGVPLTWGMTASQWIEYGLGLMANYTTKEPQLQLFDAKCPQKFMKDAKDTRKISNQTVGGVLLLFFEDKLEGVSASFNGESVYRYFESGLGAKYGEPKKSYGRNAYNAIVQTALTWIVGKTIIELNFHFLKKYGTLTYSCKSAESVKASGPCQNKGKGQPFQGRTSTSFWQQGF